MKGERRFLHGILRGKPCKKLRFLVFMGFYTVFLPPC